MQVPLLDLKAQYATLRDEIEPEIAAVFEAQWFIGGPKVAACEEAIAAYSDCAHGVGVSSGTDALLIALICGFVACFAFSLGPIKFIFAS